MSDIGKPYIQDQKTRKLLEESMQGRLRYTLMNDFLSKYSLQKDLYALNGLLAALLHLDPDDITDLEILNPILPGMVINDRNCILDINLELNHRDIINIEIQSRHQDFWPERSITYLCRNFDHLKEGEGYDDVRPCVQIGILNHDLFREGDDRFTGEFYSEYELLNLSTHTRYSSKFAIKVLSLNRMEDAEEREKQGPNGLYYWAKLFRAQSWEELKMAAKDNPRMESFVGTVRELTAEEQVLQACEARRRYTQDIATYEGEIKGLNSEIENLHKEKVSLEEERDKAAEERDKAAEERDKAAEERDKAAEERDKAAEERDKAAEERDKAAEECLILRTQQEKDRAEMEAMRKMIGELRRELDSRNE